MSLDLAILCRIATCRKELGEALRIGPKSEVWELTVWLSNCLLVSTSSILNPLSSILFPQISPIPVISSAVEKSPRTMLPIVYDSTDQHVTPSSFHWKELGEALRIGPKTKVWNLTVWPSDISWLLVSTSSNLKSQTSNLKPQTSNLKPQISNLKSQTSPFGTAYHLPVHSSVWRQKESASEFLVSPWG